MRHFKKNQIPELPFLLAIKKSIPQRCVQINEDFEVETLEGVLKGKAGDFLMIGVEGEMYPCDANIFYKTYDIVNK
jgi:hypothetical protein